MTLAMIILLILFFCCGAFDFFFGEVPDGLIYMLAFPSIVFWIQQSNNFPFIRKIYLFALIVVLILLVLHVGEMLVTKNLVGGADIKILLFLMPTIATMGYLGALYLAWFFVFNPLSNKLLSRKGATNKFTEQKRIRFIPYMWVAFFFLVVLGGF